MKIVNKFLDWEYVWAIVNSKVKEGEKVRDLSKIIVLRSYLIQCLKIDFLIKYSV